MCSIKRLDLSKSVRYAIGNMLDWEPEDIKDLRKKVRLSQRAFAEVLGVTTNYVYILEKGLKKPGKTLKLLLDCINREFRRAKRKSNYGKGNL